jgi:hypothetical protein
VLQREAIIEELEKRMTEVSGVLFVARNPEKAPSYDDLPCVSIFEMPDTVDDMSKRGGMPSYKRSFQIVLEIFISGSTATLASKELMAFMKLVKVALHAAPYGLDATCGGIREDQYGRVLRPGVGEHVIGIGLAITIFYVEDINQY